MMKRRVVVTGLGAVTPLGNTAPEFWAGVKAGKVGIAPITKFDTTDYKVKLAAEVKDFVAKDRMDFKAARRMEAFSQYAVAAAKEAYDDAGLDIEKEDSFRAGVIIGSGIGSLQQVESSYEKIKTKGPNKVNPLMVPLMISNMAAGNVSIQLGFRGKCTNVVTACATGTHCIGDAFRAIQYGDADIMLAGGTESAICATGVAGFTALTALSTNPDPATASRPFDKDRDGFVMGEGAGVVVLEELEHAKARGAKIYAEVVGYGATGDAYHITSPAEDGAGAAKAMELAMEEAEVAPSQVEYINAHGTSTHHNDLFETRAIKKAFGDAAKDVVKIHDRPPSGGSRRRGVHHPGEIRGGRLYPPDHGNRGDGRGLRPELCGGSAGGEGDPLRHDQLPRIWRAQRDTADQEIRRIKRGARSWNLRTC